MARERSARDYYDVPTEYGGVGGDQRRLNPAMLRGSTAQRAQDMRRQAIRTMNDDPRTGQEWDKFLRKR